MEIPNSLPLWAFYGSDEIPDIDFIPKEQYPQFKNSFIKIYQDILQGITTGNIDALLPLFTERNQENDRAFYYEPGHTAKRLKQVFMNVHEKLKKNEAKPLTVDAKYLLYDYQGKNLVRLERLQKRNDYTPAIAVSYPKLHMSESFEITFRRKNGQWIVSQFTRVINDN